VDLVLGEALALGQVPATNITSVPATQRYISGRAPASRAAIARALERPLRTVLRLELKRVPFHAKQRCFSSKAAIHRPDLRPM
jgi:hypothetical protein